MIKFTLDQELLARKITAFRKSRGRGAIAELQQAADVQNIGRIERGDFGATVETWLRLHLAFPEDIPPPTTTGGGMITYIGAPINHPLYTDQPPLPGELNLQRLYLRNRSVSVVEMFTNILTNVERSIKDECKAAS